MKNILVIQQIKIGNYLSFSTETDKIKLYGKWDRDNKTLKVVL